MPPTNQNHDSVTMGLCCDRRGDTLLELGQNVYDIKEVEHLWGSSKHWEIFDKIDVKDCPRCTYQPHNQIYEHVIKNDSMTYKFI